MHNFLPIPNRLLCCSNCQVAQSRESKSRSKLTQIPMQHIFIPGTSIYHVTPGRILRSSWTQKTAAYVSSRTCNSNSCFRPVKNAAHISYQSRRGFYVTLLYVVNDWTCLYPVRAIAGKGIRGSFLVMWLVRNYQHGKLFIGQ